VSPGVRRIVAPSDAPGLVDIYEQTDETEPSVGNGTDAVVFAFSAQEPAPERVTTDSMHMPPGR
jgi:hypothetical protein